MATKKAAIPVRERKAVSIYPEPELLKKLETSAREENRSVGNMAAEILTRYFSAKEKAAAMASS